MVHPQHLTDAEYSLKLAGSTIFIVFFACKIQNYLIKQCCRSKFRSATKYFGSPNFEVFYDTSLMILSFLFAEIFSVTHRLINFFLGFIIIMFNYITSISDINCRLIWGRNMKIYPHVEVGTPKYTLGFKGLRCVDVVR